MSDKKPVRRVRLFYLVWYAFDDASRKVPIDMELTLDDVQAFRDLSDGREIRAVSCEDDRVYLKHGGHITMAEALDLLVPKVAGLNVKPDGDTEFRIVYNPNREGWVKIEERDGERDLEMLLFAEEDTSPHPLFPGQAEHAERYMFRRDRWARHNKSLLRRTYKEADEGLEETDE